MVSFNPLVDNFSKLSDLEVESKVTDLGRKYFMSRNPEVQMQIAALLGMYKEEMQARRARSQLQSQQNGNSDLDNLINIS
jgi:hypothetical protein